MRATRKDRRAFGARERREEYNRLVAVYNGQVSDGKRTAAKLHAAKVQARRKAKALYVKLTLQAAAVG